MDSGEQSHGRGVGQSSPGLLLGQKSERIPKVRCEKCQFLVNPVGHEERCRVSWGYRKQVVEDWDNRRLLAWINDAVHALDVKLAINFRRISGVERGQVLESYTSNKSMAEYWNGLDDTSHLAQPSGTSEHSIGTAFECNYSGEFRLAYLKFQFPDVWEQVVVWRST